MAAEAKEYSYKGSFVESFQVYLEQSGEHQAMLRCVNAVLPEEFKRIGADKKSLSVLGVGSGGGEMDVQLLSLLQSTLPAVPITADIVEGSCKLTDNFKALVAKTANLEKVTFDWHIINSEDYLKQVNVIGDAKKFDFIHMIQMIYYADDLERTIKFYHSLLKPNGRLMIIVVVGKGGWDTLWKAYEKELHVGPITQFHSSAEVVACLKNLGLKYDQHNIFHSFDITECFNPSSITGNQVLNFLTSREDFHQSLTPEIRAGIIDLLRNKCSTEKDGRVFFNDSFSCILVDP
ncbi:histamine N-methyltransferase A-like [Parambassis ranga]|uniref:Histamine N-methyltransferase A-like n=1 Tax=Parambassis ranga TaxID=210632 RepID=A0A6P7KJ07_9TELE|nr:histamine N-methyltransferase A-like [Parambassis ranga]